MAKTLEELLKLPAAERAEIAITLWDSVAESADVTVLPLSVEQKAELERRLAEHERDPSSAIP
jgi:putative addiction module component (TIGR02574 family)